MTSFFDIELLFYHMIIKVFGCFQGDKKGEPWEGDCSTREGWEKLIQNPKIIGERNKGVIVEHEVELKEKRPPRLYFLDSIQEELGKNFRNDTKRSFRSTLPRII